VYGVAVEPVPSLSHSTPFPASPLSTNCGSLFATPFVIVPVNPKSKSKSSSAVANAYKFLGDTVPPKNSNASSLA
jgi:hypothetical protein